MTFVLKNDNLACVIALSSPAIMELVLIATCIEAEASPITAIGESRGRLQ